MPCARPVEPMSRKHLDKTVALKRDKLDSGRLLKSQASLVILEGAEIGRDFRLRRGSMVLGRGVTADIRIVDDLASRDHARIELTWDPARRESVFRLFDLGSTNHTFVNSHQVDRADLKDGDKIQIGDTVLKFVLLDDIEARFHAEVRHRISYDQLTGLLTKESLFLALDQELARAARYSLPLAVLMMDLDRFKSVNDTHGHLMGSHVLSEVGRLIRESIRTLDVSGRYGGEEFVSYLPETSLVAAHQVAERIRSAIERQAFTLDTRTIPVTISIGIAVYPEHGRDLGTLVARADSALYRAKESGRNRVSVEPKG
jgi:two-component system, cell cycle response regulator